MSEDNAQDHPHGNPHDKTRGRFVWFDLASPDLEAAKSFYPAVVGWGTQVFEAPGMAYTMWTAGERPIGGNLEMTAQAAAGLDRPHWLAYIGVPAVDATVARAQELGAKAVMPPTDIPSVGRFAVIADPQGALTAPFTPAPGGMSPPEGPPPMGDFSWHELATSDSQAAFAFYSELYGWVKVSEFDMGPDLGIYQLFGRGGAPLGGMYTKTADLPGPPAWLPYARVADINAATEAVRQHGGQIQHGPVEVPTGDWVVMILDNQGTPFAMHQVKGE
ncbi:MAG TPA: VOC family protein [Thermoanaerobaculia bacterium]|nr:VOC family protein [Thermoanaerobaculia bacterium]